MFFQGCLSVFSGLSLDELCNALPREAWEEFNLKATVLLKEIIHANNDNLNYYYHLPSDLFAEGTAHLLWKYLIPHVK